MTHYLAYNISDHRLDVLILFEISNVSIESSVLGFDDFGHSRLENWIQISILYLIYCFHYF